MTKKAYNFAKPLTQNAAFDEWRKAMPGAALLDAFRAGVEYAMTDPSGGASPTYQELLAAQERDAGDAATMRGFLKEHHMTPSMVVSLMMHWQRRAREAESRLGLPDDNLARIAGI